MGIRYAIAWQGARTSLAYFLTNAELIQDTLTDANYQMFFNMTVEVLVRPWERMVQGMRFTEACFCFDRYLPNPAC